MNIVDYSWTQTDNTGIVLPFTNDSKRKITFTVPDVEKTTTFTFQLVVTDNNGLENSATVGILVEKEKKESSCFISTMISF